MKTIAAVSEEFDLSQDTLRYYERVGIIPPVNRTASGIRDYTEEDCAWVGQVKCMRAAGLSVEALSEYQKLFALGDKTISARLALLEAQRSILCEQKQAIDETLERLDYKIGRYEIAVETGVLSWE